MRGNPNSHGPAPSGEREVRDFLKGVLSLSAAPETEAVLSVSREALTRFAHNAIHQNVAEEDGALQVRAAFGRRVGWASTNDLSPQGVERVVEQACSLARLLPQDLEWPGLAEPQPIPSVQAYDEAVASLPPDLRAREVAEICRAARAADLLASGAFSSARREYAVMNSKDLFAWAPSTQAELTFVVEDLDDRASSYAHATGWRLEQVETESLARTAVERALLSRHPRPANSCDCPVVLNPYAVVSLLEMLSADGMGALAVQEGRSWMNGKLGLQSLSEKITIVDDALDPGGLPQAFDCEGVPKRRVPIVVAGVPASPVYDRLTAAREAGRESTGHAQPYEDEDWDGPLPENLLLVPGDLSVEEMISTLDFGLYVTRFWYVNLTAPGSASVTGTTRDGLWWIERGELAYPVENLRFDQNLLEAFRHVIGVGRESRTLAGFNEDAYRVPALALESFRFIEVG